MDSFDHEEYCMTSYGFGEEISLEKYNMENISPEWGAFKGVFLFYEIWFLSYPNHILGFTIGFVITKQYIWKKGPTPWISPWLKKHVFLAKEEGGIDMIVGKLWYLKHILYFLSHICIKL